MESSTLKSLKITILLENSEKKINSNNMQCVMLPSAIPLRSISPNVSSLCSACSYVKFIWPDCSDSLLLSVALKVIRILQAALTLSYVKQVAVVWPINKVVTAWLDGDRLRGVAIWLLQSSFVTTGQT